MFGWKSFTVPHTIAGWGSSGICPSQKRHGMQVTAHKDYSYGCQPVKFFRNESDSCLDASILKVYFLIITITNFGVTSAMFRLKRQHWCQRSRILYHQCGRFSRYTGGVTPENKQFLLSENAFFCVEVSQKTFDLIFKKQQWFPSSSWSCQCPCGCGTVVKRYITSSSSSSTVLLNITSSHLETAHIR